MASISCATSESSLSNYYVRSADCESGKCHLVALGTCQFECATGLDNVDSADKGLLNIDNTQPPIIAVHLPPNTRA